MKAAGTQRLVNDAPCPLQGLRVLAICQGLFWLLVLGFGRCNFREEGSDRAFVRTDRHAVNAAPALRLLRRVAW